MILEILILGVVALPLLTSIFLKISGKFLNELLNFKDVIFILILTLVFDLFLGGLAPPPTPQFFWGGAAALPGPQQTLTSTYLGGAPMGGMDRWGG